MAEPDTSLEQRQGPRAGPRALALELAIGYRLSAIDVRSEHSRGSHPVRVLRAAAQQFVKALGIDGGELSVLLVGDARMRSLNKSWRRKDKPTDVLSFPAQPIADGRKPIAAFVGDVVISLDTAARQAREGGWSLSSELRRLLAHGILHCLGHDHQRPAQAREMARAEEKLLGRAGLVGASLSQQQGGRPLVAGRGGRIASTFRADRRGRDLRKGRLR